MFKRYSVFRFVAVLIASVNGYAGQASVAQQQAQILQQAGCYDVTFDFKETQTFTKAPPSRDYFETGLEYVHVEVNQPGYVSLQHVLVTPFGPLKHWRQVWIYEGKELLEFQGDRQWKTVQVGQPQGRWVQRVYQVDDSPRYECSAEWNAGTQSWECLAPSPLPRREFTVRSDYNVLMRGNTIRLTDAGWVHGQRNEKLVKATGEVLAVEEGANTYLRTDSKRCEPAEKWWVDNGPTWRKIQAMWDHVRGHHPDMKFKARVDGKLLWERLFEIADEAVAQATWESKEFKKTVHDVIHDYFE